MTQPPPPPDRPYLATDRPGPALHVVVCDLADVDLLPLAGGGAVVATGTTLLRGDGYRVRAYPAPGDAAPALDLALDEAVDVAYALLALVRDADRAELAYRLATQDVTRSGAVTALEEEL